VPVKAILFDLDGTLADTAPDLGAALNRLLEEEGLPPLPLNELRPLASAGGRGLIGTGFKITVDDARYPDLLRRFLDHYERDICVHTQLFPGVPELLVELEQRAVPWGIVTNKAHRFTRPLLEHLSLNRRAACIVSGDTAARSKPDPAPLLMACDIAKVQPESTIYVGDDIRDVVAGRAAGMRTVIAAWGYLSGGAIAEWGADKIIDGPAGVIGLISANW
jgi:N-acetyl-D-muramate 6-phosphate phosphatase